MSKKEINKGFIDYLRLNFGTINWIFDKTEQSEIVPKELTHGYLLSNFNIDDSIYEYYHLPTSNLLSDSEFQKMKDTGFVGNKETALRPYSNIVYGAYYSRSDLVWKLTVASHRQMFIDGKEIKYFADLIPYFKEYAKGFQDGFNEFDNKQINPFLTPFPEKQDYVNKVFEYITKNLFFKHGWANLRTGFTTNQHEEILAAFEDGQQQGYFYRAWSTVFSNNNLFAPLFQEYFKALPPQPIVKSPFSVLEWATIFYYADETKLLSESPLLKTRLEQFMSKHQINTTFDNFKTKYYEAKKRINEKNDYPINKLELIIPFLKENYKQTVTKVENDIIFLEENKPEY